MTERMTTTHAQRGALGGAAAARRMTPEARQERARKASLAGIPSRVEKSWADLDEEARDRIRRVALGG